MIILKMSLSASVLILAVVVIRALAIYRLPKKTFLFLWGVVLYRLLIPFSIPLRFNVYNVKNVMKSTLTETKIPITMPNVTAIPNEWTAPDIVNHALADTAGVTVSPIVIVWLIGLVICALFILITHLHYRQDYKTALPIDNEFITKWLYEHPLRRTVKILQSDKIAAPLTYGIWKPVVLLPKTIDWTNETKLRYILAHEYVHINRLDVLSKWLLAAVLCIHWFNPFVWVMYVLANRDIELSCDETVVRTFGKKTRSSYALTLIELEERKKRLISLCSYFSKNMLEERIVSIMKMRKTSLVGTMLAITLVISMVIVGCSSVTANFNNNSRTISEASQPNSSQTSSEQNSLKEKLVLIDPGHGGDDIGATYTNGNDVKIEEKELNLKVSLLLRDMLKESGVRVELTRQDDQKLSLEDRMELANDLGASLFVSVHFQNIPDSTKKGTLTQYNSSNDSAAYGITGQKAAQLIHDKVTKELQTENAGLIAMSKSIKYDSLKMPAMIIDLAFISNESDRKKIITEEFSIEAARALKDGIIAVLNEI